MAIQLLRPEIEALIHQQLQTGAFKDAEDVVYQALQSFPSQTARPTQPSQARDMLELFAPLGGLNLVFEADRAEDAGRDIDL